MMKRILCLIMVAMAFSFAQEETYIRNICDTLGAKKVELQLQQIEETMWYGSKNLSKADSVKKTVYKDYLDVKPYKNKFNGATKLPVSITASCVESQRNLFQYAIWSDLQWSLVNNDNDYATMIMDANQFSFKGYDATNSFNIIAIKKGSLPQNNSFSTNDLMVSKTFEFSFDWWYSIAFYFVGTKYSYASVVALDSLTAANTSVNGLDVPDSVSKVQLQILHGVLVDPNKNLPASSSSVASSSSEEQSSSSEVSSSSVEASSSSEQLSSSEVESSSSEHTTVIGRLVNSPRAFKAREIRRLDGSKIKAGEVLVPGVYYVKGADGRWKKQVELP